MVIVALDLASSIPETMAPIRDDVDDGKWDTVQLVLIYCMYIPLGGYYYDL